ncbi:MAG: hypothetical protein IH987_13990 [Planctomycetes bacterium]|nr:hypothetical protein [Planctomycetota bacterium]
MLTESLGRILFTFVVLYSPGFIFAELPALGPVTNGTEKRAGSVLAVIPGDALVAVAFPDLKTLDARVESLGKILGVPVQPLVLAKAVLGIAAGIDDHGSAAVVIIPVTPGGPIAQGIVLILPTSNRAELLAFFDPSDMGGGVTQVTIRGKRSYAASRGGYTVFGSDIETVKSVVSSGRPLVAQCSDKQLELIASQDVSVYVNVAALIGSAIGKRFEAWLSPQIGFADLLDTMGSLLISARAESGGVSVSVLMEDRLPRRAKSRPATSETFLRGLPDEPFAVAAGGLLGEDDRQVNSLTNAVVSAAVGLGIVRTEQREKVRAAYAEMVGLSAQVAASMSLLSGQEFGAIGAIKIIATRGKPERLVRAIQSLVELLGSDIFVDTQYTMAMGRLEWRSRAEVRSGVEIDHIVLPLDQLGTLDREKSAATFGTEGFLVRLGAVDDKYVVLSLGGGVDRFDRIVQSLRAGRAPLASSVAVQVSRTRVSQERFFEAYVSVDRWLRIWSQLSAIVGVQSQFSEMPEVNAPVAVAIHEVGPAATQIDLFVPVELLVAFKTVSASTAGASVMTDVVQGGTDKTP